MSIALVAHVGGSGTTAPIDTTGANLLIAYVYGDETPPISDSKSNVWTPLTAYSAVNPDLCRLFYCLSPIVGTGHTFSSIGGNGVALFVEAFSGVGAYLSDSGASTTGAIPNYIDAGPLTPTIGGLLVTGVAYYSTPPSTVSIDSGFTITDQLPVLPGTHYAGGMAYEVVASVTPVNPRWTISNYPVFGIGASMAAFSAAGATQNTRITQSAIEVLTGQTGVARITQSAVETLVGLGLSCAAAPNGRIGVAYSQAFLAGSGDPPYTFSLVANSLPPGLALNAATGVVAGTPTGMGTFPFTLRVTDSLFSTATANCSITITGGIVITLYGWKLYKWEPCADASEGVELPPVGRAV
jgi:hypothetical protein